MEKVLGRAAPGRETITSAVASQMARLSNDSVIGIRVSGADFSDGDLAQLHRATATSVSVDPALGRGDCLIDLRLGHVVVSPAVQWARLRTFLDERVPLDLAA